MVVRERTQRYPVFSLSFSSAGKGQFLTGIFKNNLYSFSKPSRGCRRLELLLEAVNFRGYRLIKVLLFAQPSGAVLKPSFFCLMFFVCFKQIVKSQAHSVSYTLSRGNAVVVEYSRDPSTDMFQVRHQKLAPNKIYINLFLLCFQLNCSKYTV